MEFGKKKTRGEIVRKLIRKKNATELKKALWLDRRSEIRVG